MAGSTQHHERLSFVPRHRIRQRFDGEIFGFGTQSGTRIIIGRWTSSPYGSFADAMVENADGHRMLFAPSDQVADFISGVYTFDQIAVGPVDAQRTSTRLTFSAGPLQVVAGIGRRDGLGWLLRCVPRPVSTSTWWAAAIDPVARRVLRGVRTRGSTEGGREYYGAIDRHVLIDAATTWDGVALGAMTDVVPPVRFGFSSTPPAASVVGVVTTVITESPARDGGPGAARLR
jgi:hypothetical protein